MSGPTSSMAADAAASIGLLSTTSAHGAKSAAKTDWQPLADRECIILPDADELVADAAGWRRG